MKERENCEVFRFFVEQTAMDGIFRGAPMIALLGLTIAVLSGCLLAGPASALTQEEIDEIRDSISATERQQGSGAGYAQLIGFITDPDVSAITFDLDEETHSTLDIYKLPLQFKLGAHLGWTLFVRGGLNYATYDADDLLEFLPSSDNIDTQFTAYSGSLGLVVKKPLNADWTFAAALDAGLARFENEADYKGISEVFAPFLDDLLLRASLIILGEQKGRRNSSDQGEDRT